MERLKNCLIVVNTAKDDARRLETAITAFLRARGVASESALFPNVSDIPFAGRDFVITLGGDGTVLFAARSCAPLGIPVFPVNLGEFGFIANIQRGEWEQKLGSFLDGNLAGEPRAMVEVEVIGEKIFTSNALNDIVIIAKNTTKLITLDISCNGVSFGRFKTDAIVVATATGSTAYSAAAGGPIIDPLLDALVLTPVCPFSLSSRPLVLPHESELDITLPPSRPSAVQVLADGQFVGTVSQGTEEKSAAHIRIKKSKYAVKLAGSSAATFYAALRSKMNWSGGPVA
jgi:NAD+ kinase